MKKPATVLVGYRMPLTFEVLKLKDREKYGRVSKLPALEHCPLCIEQECELYGTGVCLGGMK